MKEIIAPVDRDLLEAELTEKSFLRNTNKGGNAIYTFTASECPNLMKEVGRLREISFRQAGGGTGKEIDIDHYDTGENPYRQLIVWDPDTREILGGYRYILCKEACVNEENELQLATGRLFKFSEEFKKDYLPHLIELGRSFIQPLYQSTRVGRKALYALDNLWDGLGALWVHNQEMKYYFGKVTMYQHFNKYARDLILFFLNKYFHDDKGLIRPVTPLELHHDPIKIAEIFTGKNYKDDYKILNRLVRDNGENIPPLINAYMNLSPSMRTFGTATNDHFGGVEETGIMITIKDIYEKKIERHIITYIPNNLKRINFKFGSNLLKFFNRHK